jgi:hypothetical protein
MNEPRTPTNAATGEALIEALRAQSAQVKALTDAYADIGRAAAELLRRTAAAREQRTASPPVSTQLRGFAQLIADKAIATSARRRHHRTSTAW